MLSSANWQHTPQRDSDSRIPNTRDIKNNWMRINNLQQLCSHYVRSMYGWGKKLLVFYSCFQAIYATHILWRVFFFRTSLAFIRSIFNIFGMFRTRILCERENICWWTELVIFSGFSPSECFFFFTYYIPSSKKELVAVWIFAHVKNQVFACVLNVYWFRRFQCAKRAENHFSQFTLNVIHLYSGWMEKIVKLLTP